MRGVKPVLVGLVALVAAPAAADPEMRRFETAAPLTRDAGLNRIARRAPMRPVSAATAQANLVAIQQEGRGNTVFLNIEQRNTGTIAAGVVLNGALELD